MAVVQQVVFARLCYQNEHDSERWWQVYNSAVTDPMRLNNYNAWTEQVCVCVCVCVCASVLCRED